MRIVSYFSHNILISHFHALGLFPIFHSTQLIETRRNKVWKKKMPEGLKKNQERIRACTMLKLLWLESTTPREKTYVYLVKWAGYDEDQNTWEPKQNLISARESNVNKGAMSSDYCY